MARTTAPTRPVIIFSTAPVRQGIVADCRTSPEDSRICRNVKWTAGMGIYERPLPVARGQGVCGDLLISTNGKQGREEP